MTARPGRLAPAQRDGPHGRERHHVAAAVAGRDGPRLHPDRPRPRTSPQALSGGSSAARPAPSPAGSTPPAASSGTPGGTRPRPAAPQPSGAPPPARSRQAESNDWPAAAGLDEDELDLPGYRPWCRYRPATGHGHRADFPPARPRPRQQTREVA